MKKSSRRKVSYVVNSSTEEQAHCLGVNSLAIHPATGILYSAGRDGIVAAWDLHLNEKGKTTCTAFSQIHTDWVNDIVYCDDYVVSASSDRTIKLWKPHSPPQTLGWHTDFAKCLTYASQAGWVASGGLDRRINVWDIQKQEQVISIDATPATHHNHHTAGSSSFVNGAASKCSIYSIATNPSGSMIASGSPEKVVRLWDPRSGKRISKLTGHTDNIRALLMSDDGHYILSGSSDSTIKLWSVKAQRCLTTYETHPDSVWSLYSNHPDLKVFYSGSRDGLVIKTEISGEDVYDGESECVALFKENAGVAKITALDDTYVWTATSNSSINRWLSVPPLDIRQNLPPSLIPDIPPFSLVKLASTKAPFSSQRPDSFIASDSLTMYAGSILSIPVSYQEEEVADVDILVPLRTTPDHVIEGKPGIISHLVLSDRRHVLTKDTHGVINMWDLAECKLIKTFGKSSFDEVAQELNSRECFPSWCSVDTKIGTITVQLHEFNCFDCEMYTDEMDLPSDYEVREDQRLNVGKWVLSNLFKHFVDKELEDENNGETRLSDDHASKAESIKIRTEERPALEKMTPSIVTVPKILTETLKMPSTAVTTNAEQSPYLPSSPQAAQFNQPFPTAPVTTMQMDYFSTTHHLPSSQPESTVQPPLPVALPLSPLSPSSGTFMNRLKTLSSKAKSTRIPSLEDKLDTGDQEKQVPEPSQSTSKQTPEESTPVEPETKNDQYTPPKRDEFPPLNIPPSTMIIIAEESAEASTGIDLYRGTVESTGDDADTIIQVAPPWLLSYLLYNKIPVKEAVKLTFSLKPDPSSKLNELPGGLNNRLSANRILRIRKLGQYIADKLQMEDESSIELLCNETVLTPTMTLASVKRSMKSNGDIPITYRLKESSSS
ncbi:WD40-repeat-containing domain protein [Pilobolus umbonatus]|nr:WD40-repeat-containing domain protein [Pilobolus umbonatus]